MLNKPIDWSLLSQLNDEIKTIEKGRETLDKFLPIARKRISELKNKSPNLLTEEELKELQNLERHLTTVEAAQKLIAKTETLIGLTKCHLGIGEALDTIKKTGSPN